MFNDFVPGSDTSQTYGAELELRDLGGGVEGINREEVSRGLAEVKRHEDVAGIDALRDADRHNHRAAPRLDAHRLAFRDTEGERVVGVDIDERVRRDLIQGLRTTGH